MKYVTPHIRCTSRKGRSKKLSKPEPSISPTCWLLPSFAGWGVTDLTFSCLKSVKVTFATTKERPTMGRKKQGRSEEALDKTVGRLAEGAGRVAGDKSLEAEGRATRRKAQLKTYVVVPHADGGWKVQTEGASRATSVHRTKPEAVAAAKELARGKAPSQLLVYKKDGLSVQEEQTYG
jgi:uncharacterized protein YjbJ (UPF0337 family)